MANQLQTTNLPKSHSASAMTSSNGRPQASRNQSSGDSRNLSTYSSGIINSARSISGNRGRSGSLGKQSANEIDGGSGTSLKGNSSKSFLQHHNNMPGSPKVLARNRSRQGSSDVSMHNAPSYHFEEKLYLKKIRNQLVDDYYTKGIGDADYEDVRDNESNVNDEEDADEEDDQSDNRDFLADISDNKYQIDYNLTLALLINGRSSVDSNDRHAALSKGDVDNPVIVERLEWQSMLASVLTGDVVKSEKTKIINNNNYINQGSFLHAKYKESLWLGIWAKLLNRTEDDQRKYIAYRRNKSDDLFESILNFEVSYDDIEHNPPRAQVSNILERYDKCCDLWRSLEDMKNEKPITATTEFQTRIDALNSWLVVTDSLANERKSLTAWVGNEELDITKNYCGRILKVPKENESLDSQRTPSESDNAVEDLFDDERKSLVERLVKERDVNSVFKRRFFSVYVWIVKAKVTCIKMGHIFEQLRLPDYINHIIELCNFPMKLIKEIIKLRLMYAKKLVKPTLMMIDQMIDDLKSYISVALTMKVGSAEYAKANETRTWILEDLMDKKDDDFDQVFLECVTYYLELLNKKLLDGSRSSTNFRTFKEPEELEEAWNFLRCMGTYINGGSVVVAENITLLTQKLIRRLWAYFNSQIKTLTTQDHNTSDLIRWYSATTENFGQLRRKLGRFAGELSRDLTNSLVFDVSLSQENVTKKLLEHLKESGHFLVYTDTVEKQGTYFFASPDLSGNEIEIMNLINGTYIGTNFAKDELDFLQLLRDLQEHEESNVDSPTLPDPDFLPLENETSEFGYILAICPPKPIVWDGAVISLGVSDVNVTEVEAGQILVVTKLAYHDLHIIREKIMQSMNEISVTGVIGKRAERRCSLGKVHQDLTRVSRSFFRMSLAVLDSARIIRPRIRELSADSSGQELINNYFVFARDYGKNSIKNQDSSRKSTIIMKLMKLSIEWVSFVCDDCNHTDPRTFRACVLALEFAMDMTRGFNILVLNDEQFHALKLKVSRCMSLLISHFDIMGARSSEAEKRKLLKWSSQRIRIENFADDESIMREYRKHMMQDIEEIELRRKEIENHQHSIGKVIDKEDLEYQYVTLLASSFSSLSIRWQKGRFIGGGTFGSVFAAANLDTGGVMAVKEIKFHDSQSVKHLVPSIRDEMRILEMLNHPNIVQYYGVEVHRHKVYIFMEFCEGGSLSNFLSFGRIEDEIVIQVYTLQMLEGLAYLHQSGVVHRDIKPENILLDHNGIIKFVDFGAAKVIATNGRTRTSSRSLSSNGNSMKLNSTTGTPMYMSPEVITGTASSSKSAVCDIWSLGCCVLEMATGSRPWANLDNEWAIMYHIAAGHKPQLPTTDQISQSGIDFISRCLVHDPKERPGALELLNDPWIVQIRQVAFLSSENGSIASSEVSSEGGN